MFLHLLLLLTYFPTKSTIILPNFIQNNIILQSGSVAYLHGYTTNTYESVTITETGSINTKYTTQSDATHIFKLTLPPHKLNTFSNFTFTSTNSITITNVGFGFVFLCSGQSNMEIPVKYIYQGSQDISQSANYKNIYLFRAPYWDTNIPQWNTQCNSSSQFCADACLNKWVKYPTDYSYCVGAFSAVCYTTGRDFSDKYKSTNGITPLIGLIEVAKGNTDILQWESIKAAQSYNPKTGLCSLQQQPSLYRTYGGKNKTSSLGYPFRLAGLFNGMLYPFTYSTVVSGIIWYQGEQNAPVDVNTPPNGYACLLKALIKEWRSLFPNPNPNKQIPFIVIQVSAATGYFALGPIREAQRQAKFDVPNGLPNVGLVVTMDAGDTGTLSLHPKNKTIVGKRTLLILWFFMYGGGGVISGPEKATFSQSGNILKVVFQNGIGVHWVGTHDCSTCCTSSTMTMDICSGLFGQVATIQMKPAGDNIVVGTIPGTFTEQVKYVRYGIAEYPQCVLENSAKLPAGTFVSPVWKTPPNVVPASGVKPVSVTQSGSPPYIVVTFGGVNGHLKWVGANCSPNGNDASITITDGPFGFVRTLSNIAIESQNQIRKEVGTTASHVYSLKYDPNVSKCQLEDDVSVVGAFTVLVKTVVV